MSRKRTVWTMALVALLLVLVLVAGPGLASMKRAMLGVKPGVTLDGGLIAGMDEQELRAWLEDVNRLYAVEPLSASVDPENRLDVQGVFPGRYGRAIDIDKTIQLAIKAKRGSSLSYVVKESRPPVALDNFPDRVIYRGLPNRREMALAINVAWGNENLDDILKVLAKHQVTATFYFVGRWVDAFPADAKKIADAGHEAANHGYSDPHMKQLSPDQIAKEIKDTEKAVKNATGQVTRLFSPPYLEVNNLVVKTARELGYQITMCQLDTADWTRPGVEAIADRVISRATPGAIILAHPTEQTAEALDRILDSLTKDGYQFVSVSQLIDERR